MKCNCNKMCDSLLKIIKSKEKKFEIAYAKGDGSLNKIRLQILDSIHELASKKNWFCNCYAGQGLQHMKSIIDSYYERRDEIKSEYSGTAYQNEISKIFDKVSMILCTIRE